MVRASGDGWGGGLPGRPCDSSWRDTSVGSDSQETDLRLLYYLQKASSGFTIPGDLGFLTHITDHRKTGPVAGSSWHAGPRDASRAPGQLHASMPNPSAVALVDQSSASGALGAFMSAASHSIRFWRRRARLPTRSASVKGPE